jgi:hypothetical protein
MKLELIVGRNLRYILRYLPDKIVGGIDINKDAITLAKKNLPGAQLECGSIIFFSNIYTQI